MENKEGKNQMDEETTVGTAFSVWGSDEESVPDKGVGGLDPAHSNYKYVNGREKTRERPALIVMAKKGDDLAGKKCVLSGHTYSSNSYRVSRKKVVQPLKSPAKIVIAKKGDNLAGKKCVLSNHTYSSNFYRVSRKKVVQPLKSKPLQQGLSDNSHSIPNRRHNERPYNVEEKRREVLTSYPTSTPTTPPAVNNASARTPARHNA